MSLENGKKFIVDAPQNTAKNVYIQSASLNGANYDKNYLNHADIMKGGIFQLKMSEQPNVKRAVDVASAPFSFSK